MVTDTQTAHATLEDLIQPAGGLIGRAVQLPIQPGEPRFPIVSVSMGDIGQPLSSVARALEGRSATGTLDGAGGSFDYDEARIKAIAEGLERYSSCAYDEKQFLWATAEELGDEALDLDSIPRCSEKELAHPRCPIVAPDKRAPMRWVRGVSLLDGRLVWVPAVMVYLHIPFLSRGERIWLPISTGCAAHTSLERALAGAICEVLERDAISLTWLQQLPLPRIELDVVPGWLEPYLERNARASSGVEHLFFDATTDMGIPTVYSIQLSPRNDKLATLVMCSTELDPAAAIAKVIRESASSRIAMQAHGEPPASWDDFLHVFDGASYMGYRDRLPAFDFLVHSPHRRRLSEMPVLKSGEARQDLRTLLARLKERNMETIAIDISTDEALRVGMRVVRVIIPALQPLSFSYRARYLAHPRLYDAPRHMGYPVRSEDQINPWPQPFA
ncbi:MAG TPA: YcaO-like family protein [Ktedonobacteraceae bacterium]|jgi:ribosomal protein S12 methylthiotransferase accessory factor|nr:YcaO-like family protein [Ktedonobacteraceae bacterium]